MLQQHAGVNTLAWNDTLCMVTVRAVLPSKFPPLLLLALDSAKMITMATMMASTATPPITPPIIAPTLAPAESTMAAQKNVNMVTV